MSAIAISYAIGAPISGAIMSLFDGAAGLKDWQWLFLLEAVPAVLGGIFVRRRRAQAGTAGRPADSLRP